MSSTNKNLPTDATWYQMKQCYLSALTGSWSASYSIMHFMQFYLLVAHKIAEDHSTLYFDCQVFGLRPSLV